MKKILISAMLVLAALTFVAADVNAQPYGKAYGVRARQSFYYYPGVNVYFNIGTRQYIYPRNNTWISAPVLPAGFAVGLTGVGAVFVFLSFCRAATASLRCCAFFGASL